MTTLKLVLTHHWYDEIASGGKHVEYRRVCRFWHKRIWSKRDAITHVCFSRGYTKTNIKFRVNEINIGKCPIDGWAGDYYRINF